MYRYLCQLCYTIVTYGERHPCFFYKDDDYVYSLPQQSDNGNAGLDEEPERLTKIVNESSFNQFPAAQQNNTYQFGPLCGRLAESDRHDENTFNTKISVSLQNIHSPFAHSTEIPTTIFGNSSKNFKPNHGTDGSVSGAAKRTSRPKKIVRKQNERSEYEASSFHVKSSEKCRPSNDARLYSISVHAKPSSIKNLKSHIKRTQLSLEDNCEASSSIPRVIFRKEFEGANAIPTTDSVELTGALIPPEVTSKVLSASGLSTSTIEEPRNFMRDSSRLSGNSSMKMHFTKDPVKGKFICDVCQKECDHENHFVIHYRKHTGEKPFVCDICLKRFSQNSDLKKHYRLHTGEKLYACDVCETRFSYKYQLDFHKSEKHQYGTICGKASAQNSNFSSQSTKHL